MRLLSEDIAGKESSEEEELAVLFNAYFDRLSYFAFKLLKDYDVANDMAQEAFIKYWQMRDRIDDHESAVRNFLYATVKNACINNLRHQKVVSDYAAQVDQEVLFEESVMQSIITAEVLHSLRLAITSLPETYQNISRLAYLEGKKNQEIADLLEMSVNTVKKQKQKVLELLRLRLAPELLVVLVLLYN